MTRHPALIRRPASLCQLAGIWRGDVHPDGTWSEPKIDGVRATWIGGELLTREGVPLEGVGHIIAALGELEQLAGRAMVFDGELLVGGDYHATLSHIGRRGRAGDAGTLWLFDALPWECWTADDDPTPLHERKAALRTLSGEWERQRADERLSWEWPGHTRAPSTPDTPIAVVCEEWLASAADVQARAEEVWAAGGEGLMLKDWAAPYRRNRSEAWRKVKREGWATRKITPIGGMTKGRDRK